MKLGSTLVVGLALALLNAPTFAEAQAKQPRATRGVRVEERLNALVPTDLVFTTPRAEPTALSAYVGRDLPVLLVFAYTRCKSLCSVVLQSTTTLIRKTPSLKPGVDYRPVLVGLDPKQTHDEAGRQQDALLRSIGFPGDEKRFRVLLGGERQVKQLADAVGFRYAWDERTEQYAHPAVLMVLNRAGRVTRYLHALGTAPSDFEAALRAAKTDAPAQPEQAGLASDLLRCFRFDPALRRHQEAIGRYFRIGGLVLFGALLSLVVLLLRWERTRQR